jgi:sugar/nucleoside kinase (ribokinase family)/fructoselysine-6-P-deglycase FrlB-like protein
MTSVGDVTSEKRVPSTGAAASPDVVVVGNLTIDDVVLPDGATSMGTVGGNAVWAALGARLWNPSVGIVTRCGDDFPTAALDELRSLGIVLDGVVSVDGPTIRNWVVYEHDGTRRWLHRTPTARYGEVAIRADDLPAAWHESRAVHVAGMSIGAAEAVVAALRRRRTQAKITLDTHEDYAGSVPDRVLALAKCVDVFVPSREELADVLGFDDPERAAHELRKTLGDVAVVIKLGADGCLVGDGGRIEHVPAAETRVIDVTGAGDAFCGGLAAGLASGLGVSEAARRGIESAARAVSVLGSISLAGLVREDGRRGIEVMHQDIQTIPNVVASQIEIMQERIGHVAQALVERGVEHLVVTGCGDSMFAGEASMLAFARHAGLDARAIHALELARYGVRYLPERTAVVCVSYSGSVGRTIEAARQARHFGHYVLALTGNSAGALAGEVDEAIVINVASTGFSPGTSTYVGLLTALNILAAEWGAARGLDSGSLWLRLRQLEAAASQTLQAALEPTRGLAQRLRGAPWITFLGAGPNVATAKFGAAKMFEGPQRLAFATDIEEWAHEQYFISGRGTPVVVVAPDGAARDRADEILSELLFIGADATLLGQRPPQEEGIGYIPLVGDVGEELSPVVASLPLSLLGFFVAEAAGKRSYNFPTEAAEREHYDTIHRATMGEPA